MYPTKNNLLYSSDDRKIKLLRVMECGNTKRNESVKNKNKKITDIKLYNIMTTGTVGGGAIFSGLMLGNVVRAHYGIRILNLYGLPSP